MFGHTSIRVMVDAHASTFPLMDRFHIYCSPLTTALPIVPLAMKPLARRADLPKKATATV